MFKMHYFSNKFSKIANLKLRDLAKLWISKLVMTKLNLKRSVVTSFQWRRRYHVTGKRH